MELVDYFPKGWTNNKVTEVKMIQIETKENCCGCTACYSVFPKQCISMKTDSEGFQYPIVDNAKCVECGACESVCPILQKPKCFQELSAVAVQCKDAETLYNSAAGGAFSAIATVTICNGGVAFGAGYDLSMTVKHMCAETIGELKKFRSSKYVQSDMGDTYRAVKQTLDEGREVCFSGTPCQVAGLKKFLRREYENLITVDLVCKGVASPIVLAQYVENHEFTRKSKVVGMNFKRKTYGYHSSTMSVDFEDGTSYSCGGITDPMMRSFRSNICLRPSCAHCRFKGEHRASDLTIFDCWHFTELSGQPDDEKGHTSVLIHSEKGKKRIDVCRDMLNVFKIDAEQAITLDVVMVRNCVIMHPMRDKFMEDLVDEGLGKAIHMYIPITISDRIKEASKKILYKMGVLSMVKKFGVGRK